MGTKKNGLNATLVGGLAAVVISLTASAAVQGTPEFVSRSPIQKDSSFDCSVDPSYQLGLGHPYAYKTDDGATVTIHKFFRYDNGAFEIEADIRKGNDTKHIEYEYLIHRREPSETTLDSITRSQLRIDTILRRHKGKNVIPIFENLVQKVGNKQLYPPPNPENDSYMKLADKEKTVEVIIFPYGGGPDAHIHICDIKKKQVVMLDGNTKEDKIEVIQVNWTFFWEENGKLLPDSRFPYADHSVKQLYSSALETYKKILGMKSTTK